VVFSAIVLAAAFDAGGLATENLHAGKDRGTLGAGVEKLPHDAAAFEREIMATRLIGNSEICAGLVPLLAMGFDTVTTDTVLGQEMSQLVSQCALNLCGRNLQELRIQNHHAIAPDGQAGRGAEPRVPEDANLEVATSNRLEKLVCKILEQRIVTQTGFPPWKGKIIRRGANTPHDRTAEIHDELFVFHAAKAG
jgi:hypothetical protein